MEPYRKNPGRYYSRILRDDPNDDDNNDDDFDLGRRSSKPQPSAPPFGNRKDQYSFEPSTAGIIGSPSQRRSSDYHFGHRPSGLKEVADVMQYMSTYAIESAGRRRAELDLGPSSASMGVKFGEKRSSSGYEVACDMRRREYEVGPNNNVVKIIDTDLNFRVTLLDEPNNIKGKISLYNSPAPLERAYSTANSSSSSNSRNTSGRSTTPRLVTATCPFCCRKDEFERRYLDGTVTCDRCLRNFFLEEDSK